MFVAIAPTALALILFVSLSWIRNWALKGRCNQTKGIIFQPSSPALILLGLLKTFYRNQFKLVLVDTDTFKITIYNSLGTSKKNDDLKSYFS